MDIISESAINYCCQGFDDRYVKGSRDKLKEKNLNRIENIYVHL